MLKKTSEKKEQASLTIEAIISFTVFLAVSFLMLQLVKLTMVSLVMNSCTQETAKQIATSCYPVSMVNENIDKLDKKVSKIETISSSLNNILKDTSGDALLLNVMGVDMNAATSANDLFSELFKIADQGLMNCFTNIKSDAGLYITAKIMDSYLDSSGVAFDKDKVVFRLVKMPMSECEYEYQKEFKIEGEKDDLILNASSEKDGFDGDYNCNDVVICAEYDYQIVLPMIPAIKLKLRSTAVEHAWTTGCSSSSEKKESLEGIFEKNTVYVTTGGSGKKYHKKGCTMLTLNGWGYEPAKINASLAKKQGMKPCKVCNP